MPVILKVQQIYRLKISSPFVFGGFFGADWFKSVFYDEYKKQKQKKLNSIRSSFYYSWYDLEWWKKKLKEDEQQYDTQKDKNSWFSKLYKAYKTFSGIAKWYKAIKTFRQSCKNCKAVQALFGQSYNLLNQRDYRRFQANLNWTIQSAEQLFKDAIVVLLKPTIMQVAALYMKKLQQLYDKFCWFVIKSILWGTTWWQIAISIIGYAASIFTFGASAAGVVAAKAAIVGARLVSIFSKFARIGKALVGSSSRILRAVGRGALATGRMASKASGALMRGGSHLGTWSGNVARNAASGRYRKATQAFMRRHPKSLKFSKMVIQGGVSLALFYNTITDYERIQKQIRKRCHIMYMQTLPALQNLKNVGEMVGDIGSFLNNIGKDIWSSYMNAVEQQKYGEYRTNRLYGLKLKINPTDYNNNTMFVALRLFYKRFNFYRDILANGLKFVTQKSLKYHIINVSHGFDVDMRTIISQGSGKFGIALYKKIKKLVFQNVKLDNKFYKSISFSINDEDKLKMVVDGTEILTDVSVKRPFVHKHQDDYRLSKFTWLFVDGYGYQYGIKKGFQLSVANSNGKFNGITNKFCTRKGDALIFDFSTNDVNKDYLFSNIENFNNLKSIYNARVLQIEKEKKIQDECKKIVEKLKEALSQNDEGDERIRQQIIADLNSMTNVIYYQDVRKRRFQQYYQYSPFCLTRDSQRKKITEFYLDEYHGDILALSAAHGGFSGTFVRNHSFWNEVNPWGVMKQWRTVEGYSGTGEHRLQVSQAHVDAINAASGDELIQMRNRVRALKAGRRTAAQYVGSDGIDIDSRNGIYVAGGNINNQVDTALNIRQ